MKEDNTKHRKLSKKVRKLAEDEALRQQLLFRTESLIEDKGSDESLDLQNEKIKLISGREITISGIKKYVNDLKRPYEPTFPQEFFNEYFRLNGLPIEEAQKFRKPREVALAINEIIYGRFPREVLPIIQYRNPFITRVMRGHKNFEFLTDEAYEMLLGFIGDAIRVMKTSQSWHEFKVKYSNLFGLPFQTSLFDSNAPEDFDSSWKAILPLVPTRD